VKDLLAEVTTGSVFSRDAHFTLAVDKAREKLEKFQLPDPRFYILQIVQAIAASGASYLKVNKDPKLGGYRLVYEFDGPGYTRAELERLYDSLFESGRARDKDRTREMALGLLSCQARDVQRIRLSSNGFAWEKRPGHPESCSEEKGLPSEVHRVEVLGRGEASELELLASHCGSCKLSILLNNDPISGLGNRIGLECPWPNFLYGYDLEKHEIVRMEPAAQALQTERTGVLCEGALGIAYGEMQQTTLTLLRYGVQYARRYEPRIKPPMVVVCEHPGLRKNVSQSDVVEDSVYLKFIEVMNRIQMAFSVGLAQRRIPSYHVQLVQQYLVDYFQSWYNADLLTSDLEAEALRVPLFNDLNGRRVTMRDLVLQYRKYRCVLYCQSHPPGARRLGPDPLVVLVRASALALLQRVFDSCVAVDGDLEGTVLRVTAEAETRRSARLPRVLVSCDGGLSLPNRYPDGHCTAYLATNDGAYQAESFDFHGLSLLTSGKPENLAPRLPELYEKARHILLNCKISPKTRVGAQRCIEHQLTYLQYLLETGQQLRPETVRLLDRSQRWVTLADIASWLAVFPNVVVCQGGIEFANDFGLAGSQRLVDLLGRLHGPERVLVTSVSEQYIHERQQQGPLSGAADGLPLQVEEEVSEEQELRTLREEYEAARVPEPEPPPEPLVAAPAAPEPAAVSPPVPESLGQALLARLDEQLAATACVVSHRFERPGLEGHLVLPNQDLPSQLHPGRLLVFGKDLSTVDCPTQGLEVSGWLRLSDAVPGPSAVRDGLIPDLDPVRQCVLNQELDAFFRKVAEEAFRYGDGSLSYSRLSGMLIRYLVWREPATDSPLRTLPWLSTSKQRYCSLEALTKLGDRQGWFGYCLAPDLPINPTMIRANSPPPTFFAGLPDDPDAAPGARGVLPELVILRNPLTLALLESWVGYRGWRPFTESRRPEGEPLLEAIKDRLWQLSDRHRYRLSDSLIRNIVWGEPSRWLTLKSPYFVVHNLNTGVTELNPNHALMRKVARRKQLGPMLAVLASSVYTAINRALAEVEDRHELLLLEALLDEADPDKVGSAEPGS
jgi:hypothetical protein